MPAKKAKLEAVDDADDDDIEAADDDSIELVEIVFRGVTFVVPRHRDEWSTEALSYLSEQKYNLFTKYNLDIAKEGQWDTLVALCPRRKDFSEFFSVFSAACNRECVD